MISRALLAVVLLGTAATFVACGDAMLDDPDGVSGDALSGGVPVGAVLVTTANVNFREAPSRTARVLRVLPKGTRVTASGTGTLTDVFYAVKFDGQEGWVHGAYLSLVGGALISGDGGSPPCSADRADGACRVFAATGRASAQNPAFSPDGTKLLFTIWKSGYNEAPAALAMIAAGGGGAATNIVDNGASNVNLPGTSWNAAKNRIVYSSDQADGPDEVYTANPDGSDARRVTHHAGRAIYQEPSFSPDGQSIVFEASYGERSAEIWSVRTDGTGLHRITQGSIDRQPNWAPVGNKILMQRLTNDWSLYTFDSDGTNMQQVTPPGDSSTDASWSPDGTRIVYSSSRGGLAGANLFVVSANGGAPTRVTNHGGYDGAVSWSPDGRWLAFESSTNPNGESVTALWRIALPAL